MSYAVYFDETLVSKGGNDVLAFTDQHLELVQNEAGKFTFTIPVNHPYYGSTNSKKTEVRVFLFEEDELPTFCGFVTKVEYDFYMNKKVTVTGDLDFLSFTLIPPTYVSSYSVSGFLNYVLNKHNDLVGNAKKKKFYLGDNTAYDASETMEGHHISFDSPLSIIQDKILSDPDKVMYMSYEAQTGDSGTWYKKFVNYVDVDALPLCSQKISLDNLVSFSADIESDDVVTVAIPLGKEIETDTTGQVITVGSANGPLFVHGQTRYTCLLDGDYSNYYVEASSTQLSKYGRVYKVLNYPRVTNPTTLYRKANRYLRTHQYENLVIEANAVDLSMTDTEFERFHLNDRVNFYSDYHGLDIELIISKIDYYLDSPEKNTITCGKSSIPTLTRLLNNSGVIADIRKDASSWEAIPNTPNASASIAPGESEGGQTSATISASIASGVITIRNVKNTSFTKSGNALQIGV